MIQIIETNINIFNNYRNTFTFIDNRLNNIMSSLAPNPIFILQNSKPITCLLFSTKNSNILYSGNRNGDLTIYDISFRRSTYSNNPNKESILSIIELDEANFLAYCRNGSIFKWIKSESGWHFNCKRNYITTLHLFKLLYKIINVLKLNISLEFFFFENN